MTRPAIDTRCSKCGVETLSGVDGDVAGFAVVVDSYAITHRAELACVVLGRRTAERDGEGRLKDRRPGQVVHRPAFWPVHAHHVCGQPLPPAPKPLALLITDTDPPF
jgi:hypothetical protein